MAIPGTLQVEMYDKGMEGVAYNDNTSQNEGNADFRTDNGVDIVKGNGGQVIGYTVAGEWLIYTVTVETEKVYYWNAFVSSGASGGAFRIYMGNTDITGKILVPRTSSWDTYTQVSGETKVALPAGTYQLRLAIETAGCNIDKVVFNSTPTGVEDMKIASFDGAYEVFSVLGIRLGNVEISNGNTSNLNGMYPQGIYILRKQDGTGESRRIMIP
jgi:hypothetical protein